MEAPNEYEYLGKVFSLSKYEPNPPLPPSFTNLVPTYSTSIFRALKPNEEQIRNSLHLNFSDRYPALSVIIENKQRFSASEVNSKYTIQFILQSISPPFLNSIYQMDEEILCYLIRLLSFVRKLIYNLNPSENLNQNNKAFSSTSSLDENNFPAQTKSQDWDSLAAHQFHFKNDKKHYKELLYQSFYFLYEKIISHPFSIQLYPNITKFLKKLRINNDSDNEDAEKKQKKYINKEVYFTELHCSSVKILLDKLIKTPNENNIIIARDHIRAILAFFKDAFISKAIWPNDLNSKTLVTDIYNQAQIFCNETVSN